MPESMRIARVKVSAAPPAFRTNGLLGWTSFELCEPLHVDAVAVRPTDSGELRPSFPARTDWHGNKHFFLRPLSHAARRHVDSAVFDALRLARKASP